MYFMSVLKRWNIIFLLIFLSIYSDTYSRKIIKKIYRFVYKVRPNYYALQQRSSLQKIHVHNLTHQQIHKHPVILVRAVSNKIGTPPPTNCLIPNCYIPLFDIMAITDVARKINFVLTKIWTRVLSLLQGVVSVLQGNALNHPPIDKQGVLGASSFRLIGAVGVGFVSYFQSPLASAIQSIDLSSTPLAPLSGLQSIIVAILEGKFSRNRFSIMVP